MCKLESFCNAASGVNHQISSPLRTGFIYQPEMSDGRQVCDNQQNDDFIIIHHHVDRC